MKEKVSGQKEWITDQGVAVNEKEMKRFAIIDAVSSSSWSILLYSQLQIDEKRYSI